MNHGAPRFPDYGRGGDHTGARRTRRAFRIGVGAWALFAAALWVMDWYARYDLLETQYRMALTHEPASARPILRNVAARDAAARDTPNPRYLEALAEREEPDEVLPLYARAAEAAQRDPMLLINYGVRLFAAGEFREARDRFREAAAADPRNALPRYLEAAAAMAGGEDEDAGEAVAILARTNSRQDPLLWPMPLWHESLPQRGEWFERLRRERADAAVMPLYRMEAMLLRRAESDGAAGQFRDWDAWLQEWQTLGERLIGGPDAAPERLGAVQALAGLQFKRNALRMREQLHVLRHGAPNAELEARRAEVEAALAQVQAFEDRRNAVITQHRALAWRPIALGAGALFFFLAAYALAYLAAKLAHAGRTGWTLRHPRWALGAIAAGMALLFGILAAAAALQRDPERAGAAIAALNMAWYSVVGVLLLFGAAYPFLALPRSAIAIQNAGLPVDGPGVRQAARKARIIAGVSLLRRYFGILGGSAFATFILWALAYRIASGLYPLQVDLLVTGYRDAELAMLRELQARLWGG